jgi:hypothetical protein
MHPAKEIKGDIDLCTSAHELLEKMLILVMDRFVKEQQAKLVRWS